VSNFDDLVERLSRIEEQNLWLVAGMKLLLADSIGAGVEATDDLDEWLLDEPLEQLRQDVQAVVENDPNEHIAVRRAPRKKCPHNQQVLVDGRVQCARCGFLLTTAGLAHGTVMSDGRVAPDPNPPAWVQDQSPGPSSKNPGGKLVPHSVA
jgi:hypothetical protein